MTAIHGEIADKKTKVSAYEEERSGIAAQVKESLERLAAAEEALKKKDEEIRALEEEIESGKGNIIDTLNEKVFIAW